MSLPKVFPFYSDGINGPHHVSLALPGKKSQIMESIGVTASSLLLVPQIEYIKKFVEGDLGISDTLYKSVITYNFSAPQVTQDEEAFRRFAKVCKIDLEEDISKYKKDGRFVMPNSKIKINPALENIGLKSVEKTILKSIFETQKPYIEITKLITENLAYAEDIVARVMPLISISPLTAKSEKPNSNAGNTSRPKSMGFGGGKELKDSLSKLETLINDKKPEVKKKLDISVVDSFFKLANNQEKQQKASKNQRIMLSKYSLVLALLDGTETTSQFPNVFDFVYNKISAANGVESKYRNEIQNFLTDFTGNYKNINIYRTNQKIENVTLNVNDIKEIVNAAKNKYKFKNAQSLPNKVWSEVYQQNILKFYEEKVPFSMVPAEDSEEDPNTSDTSGKWQILNTIYSTGDFDPNIDYIFKYVDLPDDEIKFDEKKSTLDLNDTDPFQKYKPKKIILGIYNSKGQPLNPIQPIKTIGLNGVNVVEVDTPFKKADWILRSPKWHLPDGVYNWPTYDNPVYVWEKGLLRRESKTNPDSDADSAWKIKKYKKGDKDLLTKEDAFPGNPVIARFETNEVTEYREYFDEFLNFKFHKTDTLNKQEKDKNRKDLLSRLDLQSHLQNVYLYGQNKSSTYKQINGKDPIPNSLKKAFKPYKIFSTEAAVDKEIRDFSSTAGLEPGFLWIEPESDYDMKVIRIDPVSKIKYKEAQSEDESFAEIRNFVKNNCKIAFSNGMSFTIEIRRNDVTNSNFTLAPEIISNINSYNLENWNFENSTILNDRNLEISIYSNKEPKEYEDNTYLTSASPGESDTTYELKKEGNSFYYRKFKTSDIPKKYIYFNEGDIDLWTYSGATVLEDKFQKKVKIDSTGKIIHWYYVFKRTFSGPSNKLSNGVTANIDRTISNNQVLTTFGVERSFIINYNTTTTKSMKDHEISYSDKNIPLYSIKIGNSDNSQKLIDPSKVTNSQLTIKEIFGLGKQGKLSKYGHGSSEDPQELLVIERYRLTDLDTESYFIIEGTLRNPPPDGELNLPTTNNDDASYYRLPDAIGAVKPFLSMLANIFAKLIPQITKLIELFKNPTSFLTNIISEKAGENVEFLNKESLDTLKQATRIRDEIVGLKDFEKPNIDTSNLQSNLTNAKKIKIRDLNKFIKTSPMSNYIHVKDDGNLISILDGSATIPFNIFGNSINFGIDMQLNRVTEKKAPLKLIFEKDLKLKNIKNLQSELELRKFDKKQPELKSQIQDNINKSSDFEVKFENGGSKTVESSSINSFILSNKNRYDFVIIDEETQRTYKKIDEFVEKGTPEDLRKAKDLIDKAKKQNPKDLNLLSKEKFITDKLGEFQLGDQPMIKFILGIVSLPFKLIAGVLEYIMNFFKSLINPVKLPAKLLEFLSFSWIAKFFTPKGILEVAGIRFAPEKLAEWKGLVNIPGPIPNLPKDVQLPNELEKIKELENKLNSSSIPASNLNNLTNQFNQQTGNLTNQFNQQTGNLTNQFNQPTGNLNNQFNQQTGNLTNQFNQPTGNLTNQFESLNSLNQNLNNQTQNITNSLNQLNIPNIQSPNIQSPNIQSPNINLPSSSDALAKLNTQISLPKIPDLPKSLNLPEDIKLKGFSRKNIKSGNYLFPDDFKLVDMSQFLNVIFNVKLPEYSSIQFRQNPNIGGSLIGQLKINKPNLDIPNAPEVPNLPGFSCGGGFLCFVEALINSIINFVWSLLGIEVVIEAPQIKLCNGKKPKDAADIQKNSKNDQDLDGFYYEVQLENGKTQKFLNYEELQSFIDDNKDLNYDFNF